MMIGTLSTGMKLSPQQRAIVERVLTHRRSTGITTEVRGKTVPDNMTVVSAGAGSGKTHVTVAAALELVAQTGARLDEFVLITFTNKAADELRERFESELERLASESSGADALKWKTQLELLSGAYIGTIHAFCRHLIRSYAPLLELPRDAEPSFSSRVLRDSLEEVIEQHKNKVEDILRGHGESNQKRRHELEGFLSRIYGGIRNLGFEPADVLQWTAAQAAGENRILHERILELLAFVHESVERRKREAHLIDAHDMLQKTAEILSVWEDRAHALSRISSRYSYLFVDEFQDTDRTQKGIVDALRTHLEHVLLVGDRKQAIYGFRAADASILDELAEETSARTPLPMTISRRATRRLIDAQVALFTSIGADADYRGMDQPLDADNGTPEGPTRIAPFHHIAAPYADTYGAAAAAIRHLRGRMIVDVKQGTERKAELGDIVVLTRTNHAARRWAAELTGHGIDAREEAGGRFFDAPEIIGTFRFLKFIQSPDEANLAIALDTPYLRHLDSKPEVAMSIASNGDRLTDWLRTRHVEEWRKIQQIRDASREESVPRLLSRLFETFEISTRLQNDTQAMLNLERLRERARGLMSNEQALTLRQFLSWLQVAYETDAREPEATTPQGSEKVLPYVRCMVIHQAKGLEFPLVVLPTFDRINRERPEDNEGRKDLFQIVPPPRGIEYPPEAQGLSVHMPDLGYHFPTSVVQAWQQGTEERRREEIRILYVAITRATNAVVTIGTTKWPADKSSPYYAWQHEILRARERLETKRGSYDLTRLDA